MLGLCLLGCDEFYTNAAETWWAGYGANSVIPPYCIGTTVRHADALAPAPSESAVANLPLVRPEMISGNADLAGYLLFRDEALVTMEGLADAGVDPGIVWVFSEPVVQVEIEAHLVVAAGAGVRTWLVQGADTVTTPGREWETSLEVPVAGCWQILIRAVPVGGGDPIVARAVIPVVEWRGDAISAPATPVASPEALTSTFDRGWFRESVSMPGRS